MQIKHDLQAHTTAVVPHQFLSLFRSVICAYRRDSGDDLRQTPSRSCLTLTRPANISAALSEDMDRHVPQGSTMADNGNTYISPLVHFRISRLLLSPLSNQKTIVESTVQSVDVQAKLRHRSFGIQVNPHRKISARRVRGRYMVDIAAFCHG